jgi:hypothetical protein
MSHGPRADFADGAALQEPRVCRLMVQVLFVMRLSHSSFG